MKRVLLLIALTILPATAPAQEKFGRFHALVIGNQNYQHLTKLKTPKLDAEAVAKVLKEEYGFTIDPLLDKTRSEIMAVLYDLRTAMTEKDNLLIYYAGHGKIDEKSGTGYWQPTDAEQENPANWISIDDIEGQLKAIPAKHILVVADSCYSGSMLMREAASARMPRGMERNEWLRRVQSWRSRNALTSGGDELVLDGGGSGHSVFAQAFLDVLRENKEILDGTTLFNLIKTPVIANSRQTPMYGIIYGTGHYRGDFLFVPKELQGVTLPQPPAKVDLSHLERGEPQQGDIMTDDATGIKLVYIPGGCFMMGSPESEEGRDDDESPVHEVCVDSFWMGKYEVTQGQWKKIMGGNPSSFKKGDDYPVETVSWDAAQDFIKKLNNNKTGKKYRLPTEAEWEYAARAGTSTARYWGDDLSCDKAMYGNSETWNGSCLEYIGKRDLTQNSTAPTGSYPANQFGLHDMLGNVWEWCSDWYGEKYYASRPDKEKNPSGPESGSSRVIRGGGLSSTPGSVRAANRYEGTPFSSNNLGFRLVLPVQQAPAGR